MGSDVFRGYRNIILEILGVDYTIHSAFWFKELLKNTQKVFSQKQFVTLAIYLKWARLRNFIRPKFI